MVYASYTFLFENMLKYNMLLSLEKVNGLYSPSKGNSASMHQYTYSEVNIVM